MFKGKNRRSRKMHDQGSALDSKKFMVQAREAKDAFVKWIQGNVRDYSRWVVTYRSGFIWLDDIDFDAQSSQGASSLYR